MLLLLVVLFFAFMAVGLDVFYAMGVASLAYLLVANMSSPMPIPLTVIPQRLMGGVDSFPLLAVPMFLLAGELMSRGGVTARLVHFSATLVGHLKGGLAQVAVLSNVIMSGMSGSAVADAAATGSLLIPSMVKRKYPPPFASAVIACASTVGPLIPPSIPMVIVGSLVSVSVGQLFVGGIIPGLLLAAALMLVNHRYAVQHDLPVEPRASGAEVATSFRDSLLALFAPVIVLGSILAGIATPTEASVVAVVYALVLGLFVYRELRIADLPKIFADMGVATAVVMVTVAASQLFGFITTAEGLGNLISRGLTSLTSEAWLILLIVNVVLLILGIVLEPLPILILTVPILFPIVTRLGVDPVHFGLVVVLNVQLAALTPPVGLQLFVAAAIGRVPVMDVARESWRFLLIMFVVLAILTYVPATVTWLPRLIYGGR